MQTFASLRVLSPHMDSLPLCSTMVEFTSNNEGETFIVVVQFLPEHSKHLSHEFSA